MRRILSDDAIQEGEEVARKVAICLTSFALDHFL
jgi:hypothetical protein